MGGRAGRGESPVFINFPGEVEGLEATWGDLAPDAAKCGNVEVDLGGVVVGDDGDVVEGIEGLAGDDFDDCRLGNKINADSVASAEATGPEVAEKLEQGLGRLQSAGAIRRRWFSVVEAREARKPRPRVLIAGVGKLVEGMWTWRLSGIVLQWRQARQVTEVSQVEEARQVKEARQVEEARQAEAARQVEEAMQVKEAMQWRQCRQVDSGLIKVVMARRGMIMSDGLRVWKGQVRVARERVADEARYLGQAVKRMMDRKMYGPSGEVAGCDRWWGPLGGRAGGGEFSVSTYRIIGWAGGDVGDFGA